MMNIFATLVKDVRSLTKVLNLLVPPPMDIPPAKVHAKPPARGRGGDPAPIGLSVRMSRRMSTATYVKKDVISTRRP